MRSAIAMCADVDNKGAGLDVDLVGAKIDEDVDRICLRHGGDVQALFAGDEAEIEAAYARCGAVQHVEPAPAVFHDPKRERGLGGQQNRLAVRPCESRSAKNEHRLDLVGRRMVGEHGKGFGRAEVIVLIVRSAFSPTSPVSTPPPSQRFRMRALSTAASRRGFDPITRIASAWSMPAIVELKR